MHTYQVARLLAIVFVILIALFVLRAKIDNKSDPPDLPPTIVDLPTSSKQAPPTIQTSEEMSRVQKDLVRDENASSPTIGTKNSARANLTKQQFMEKLNTNELNDLILKSRTFVRPRNLQLVGAFAKVEAGVIGTSDGKIKYHYAIGVNENGEIVNQSACISFKNYDQKIIAGFVEDSSLKIRELPIENAYLLILRDQHFFITYTDVTGWTDEPIPPNVQLDTDPSTLLYFEKQPDGRLIFKGKRETLIYPEDEMPNHDSGNNFCRIFPRD